MNIDPVAVAGLLEREVRTGERDGAPTRVVVARRTYGTDQADLWDCLTNAERLPRWFLPVSGELAVGGRYQFEGNAGGVVEACDEPSSLSVTWEMGPMVSWLTITLSTVAAGTQLELVHEAPVDPAFWEQFGPGAVGVGWELAAAGLGVHLDTGAPVDPEAGASYPLTTDGRRFVELGRRLGGGGDRRRRRSGCGEGGRHTHAGLLHHWARQWGRHGARVTAGQLSDVGVGVFEALGDPVRRRILVFLAGGEQPAGAIVASVQGAVTISQPAVSQHLKVLREAGMVGARAVGTRRLYAIEPAGVAAAQQWLSAVADALGPLAQPLDALATEVARGRRQRRSSEIGDVAAGQ